MALVTDIRSVRMERTPLLWSTPESKLWVAMRDGEYAGMIEYAEGHFVVAGPEGQRLGSHSDLARAMAALENGPVRSRLSEAFLSNVALASAVVAFSVAGMSLSMIAA
jgi:hypothetical protein